jgi:hypothetical protein
VRGGVDVQITNIYAVAPFAALWAATGAAADSHALMTTAVSTFVAKKRQGDGPGSPPRGARSV